MGKATSAPGIPNPWTIKLGSDGTTVHVDSDLDNIHIKEIAPLTVNSNIAVTQPIVTNSTSKSDSTADIKIEPMKVDTDSKSLIDLKPLAVDSCQTIKLAPLPPIRLEQPYSQHFGITFMGMELWGVNISGKSEMSLHSPPRSQYQTMHPPQHEIKECEPERKHTDWRGHGIRVRVDNKDNSA